MRGRNLQQFQQNHRQIALLGKGPSAMEFHQHCKWLQVAVINEAGLLIPSTQPIDFAFFVDVERIECSRVFFPRCRWIVMPETLHRYRRPCEIRPASLLCPEHLPKLITYPYAKTIKRDRAYRKRIAAGVPCLVITTTAALHILSMCGYRRIWCFGLDGGIGCAAGVPSDNPLYEMHRSEALRMARILQQMRGTQIRFWPDRFEEDSS